MRVFMMTDQEGVAGVVSFQSQCYEGGAGIAKANLLLTREVNAAVEGLLEAGADDVIVMDGHGPGAIVYEEIHPRALLIHGRPLSPLWKGEVKGCEAVVWVGQHAMAGVPQGNLNHTQNSRAITHYLLNGEPIGETAQFALFAGSYGVPSIFLSGDEAGCREFEALVPGGVTAAVKKGLGRNSAVSLSPEEARRRIRDGARQALEKHRAKPFPPVARKPPFVLEKRFFSTDHMESYLDREDVEIVDNLTVRMRGDDIRRILFA